MTMTLTKDLTTPKTHLDAFSEVENSLPGRGRPAVTRQRRAAIARFGELGFPGERDEDWKFTSVAPLVRMPMQTLPIDGFNATGCNALPKGVIVESIAGALANHPELVEQ